MSLVPMDRKRITSDVSVEGHGKKNSEGRRATGLLCFYMRAVYNALTGRVAELVYAYDSESYPVRVGSSSLPAPTQLRMAYDSESYSARIGNMKNRRVSPCPQ